MNEDVKELLRSLANAENAELVARLTEEFGKQEEIIRAKEKEIIETKETMIKYALRAVGDNKEDEGEKEREETIEDVFERFMRDPKDALQEAKKKGIV